MLGDWREELLVRTVDSSALRIYTSTEVTKHKLTTLMHDVQYRAEVARQNTTYNQPSYTSYYLASDMDFANVPLQTTAATPKTPKFVDLPGEQRRLRDRAERQLVRLLRRRREGRLRHRTRSAPAAR